MQIDLCPAIPVNNAHVIRVLTYKQVCLSAMSKAIVCIQVLLSGTRTTTVMSGIETIVSIAKAKVMLVTSESQV